MRTVALSMVVVFALVPACGGDISSTHESVGTGGSAGQQPQDCTGTKPSTMVALPEGFSIDATEVSRCQYQAWLDSAPSTATRAARSKRAARRALQDTARGVPTGARGTTCPCEPT